MGRVESGVKGCGVEQFNMLGSYGLNMAIRAKDWALRAAPPTSAPSMSGHLINSSMVSGVTDPPYRMRMALAASSPYDFLSHFLMAACTAWAIAGVALRPVPIAHTGCLVVEGMRNTGALV